MKPMTDDQDRTERPVLNGLIALAAVALTVGLVLGGVVLVGTRMLGIGDSGGGGSSPEARDTLYLPKPEKTEGSGPLVTLATEADDDETDSEPEETEKTKSEDAKEGISLSAGQTSVENFGRIDLTGTYPGGEGAILQVQRFESGSWSDFEATISVSDETFSSYIQTGVSGENRFRVIDKATGETSNEVKVTVAA